MSNDEQWSDLSNIPEDGLSATEAQAYSWYLVQTGLVQHRYNAEKEIYEFSLTAAGQERFDPHHSPDEETE